MKEEKLEYLNCLKRKCQKQIENINLYYNQLTKFQKSKCSGMFSQHKQDYIKCLKEKNNDIYLLKLMDILNRCSKKNCIKDASVFYQNSIFSLGITITN